MPTDHGPTMQSKSNAQKTEEHLSYWNLVCPFTLTDTLTAVLDPTLTLDPRGDFEKGQAGSLQIINSYA